MFGTRRDGEWLDTLGLTIGARLEVETLERVRAPWISKIESQLPPR